MDRESRARDHPRHQARSRHVLRRRRLERPARHATHRIDAGVRAISAQQRDGAVRAPVPGRCRTSGDGRDIRLQERRHRLSAFVSRQVHRAGVRAFGLEHVGGVAESRRRSGDRGSPAHGSGSLHLAAWRGLSRHQLRRDTDCSARCRTTTRWASTIAARAITSSIRRVRAVGVRRRRSRATKTRTPSSMPKPTSRRPT